MVLRIQEVDKGSGSSNYCYKKFKCIFGLEKFSTSFVVEHLRASQEQDNDAKNEYPREIAATAKVKVFEHGYCSKLASICVFPLGGHPKPAT